MYAILSYAFLLSSVRRIHARAHIPPTEFYQLSKPFILIYINSEFDKVVGVSIKILKTEAQSISKNFDVGTLIILNNILDIVQDMVLFKINHYVNGVCFRLKMEMEGGRCM
jgi:uncharacterized membrane protein